MIVKEKVINRGPKFTGENKKYRLEICKMLAMGYDTGLVIQELKELYGIDITHQSILKYYKNSRKRRKIIEALRNRWAADVLKHPLADKRNRLNYLLRGINHALKYAVDKLYFDKDGSLVGKVEKVRLGELAALLREARAEFEDLEDGGGRKFGLADLVKQVSEAHGKFSLNITTKRIVAQREPGTSDIMDQSGARPIEIL